MKRIMLLGFLIIIALFFSGCWNNTNELNTSLLKKIDENSYVFLAYEVVLEELPFKTQLPEYIPFKGGTLVDPWWETKSISTNNALNEVAVSLVVEKEPYEGKPESLYLEVSNYETKFWGSADKGEVVRLKSGANGNFYYSRNSEDDYVHLKFESDGVYYLILYHAISKTKEEKQQELIKMANSMVDFDKWYDKKYLSIKQHD
jgi:hypothetical protein